MEECNGHRMLYDEACLVVHNIGGHPVSLFNVSSECYGCKPQKLDDIDPLSWKSYVFSTTYPTILGFLGLDKERITFPFKQHGQYGVNFTVNSSSFYVITPPDNVYAPLIDLAIYGLIAILLWAIGSCAYSSFMSWFSPPSVIIREAENDLGTSRSSDNEPLVRSETRSGSAPSIGRNSCVDTFRGLTLTLMLFVNYGGGKYWIFEHSPWNGLTIADLVFPWFAWIMGISIILSISSQLRNSIPRKLIFKKVVIRSLILISLGIVLNSVNKTNLYKLRIPGVLQRLGLSYFIVASLETLLLHSYNSYNLVGRAQMVADVIYGWIQWVVMIFIVSVHTYITFYTAVPGCPAGYIGPGGLHYNGSVANCTGGIAGYIDRLIFTSNHMYSHPTSAKIYHSKLAFDPEGILGTLTTAFTVFLGVHAGRILLFHYKTIVRNTRWMILALCSGGLALFLTSATQENGPIPINKNLWSLSYALATSSLAYLIFTLLYVFTDHFRWWSGSPFRQVGRNSILIYAGSILLKNVIPWDISPLPNYNHADILWLNVWSTSLWITIAIILDYYRIYVKI